MKVEQRLKNGEWMKVREKVDCLTENKGAEWMKV